MVEFGETRDTHAPLRVGLTGGIASGKSTVADLFASLGVPVIDTDVIARAILDQDKTLLPAIRDAFGASVFDDNGDLDRKALRDRVFSDPEKRRRIESILHPAIIAQMERESLVAAGPYQVLVIPLLVETGLEKKVDCVLVVDCPEMSQIQRLVERDGESVESARNILGQQADRETRLAAADEVIDNSQSIDALTHAVKELDRRFREYASKVCRSSDRGGE